jgi:uncharacterized protein YecE (DUF72 family)
MTSRPSSVVSVPEADPARYRAAAELALHAPAHAVVGNVRCGTAGWTDPTLTKSTAFYPKKTMSPEARLVHYADQFSFVEVNATYYSLLPPEMAHNWLSRTEASFVFNVKAHPVLTAHPIEVARLPADLKATCQAAGYSGRLYAERLPLELRGELERRFQFFLEPLLDAGRLGAVLLQFPPWFVPSRTNVKHIEDLAARWQGFPLAIEFRNGSWVDDRGRDRTVALLARHELTYVCVDEPQLKDSVPPLTAVTNSSLAIVRFHGHNLDTWNKRGATVQQRFNYLYTPDELRGWVEPVRKLADRASEVHATFNNCVRDYAVVNAKDLAALLRESSSSAGT